MVGLTHRPDGFGAAHGGGDLPVGPGLGVGDGPQGLPHRPLKGRPRRFQRQVEVPPLSGEIGQQLLPGRPEQGGLLPPPGQVGQGPRQPQPGEGGLPLQGHGAEGGVKGKPGHSGPSL